MTRRTVTVKFSDDEEEEQDYTDLIDFLDAESYTYDVSFDD